MTALFDVLIPAAGSGSRFNSQLASEPQDKLLAELGGRPVLERSVALFAARTDVQSITIITAADRIEPYRRLLQGKLPKVRIDFVRGGRERWESVLFGLRSLATRASLQAPYVAIHDAARPLTPQELIDQAFRVTAQRGAALPCVAEPATLKRQGSDGCVSETVGRQNLFQAQTPQCFDAARLLQGYEQLLRVSNLADVTDDAQVFERLGLPVPITPGSPLNLKITTPEDLQFARALCAISA